MSVFLSSVCLFISWCQADRKVTPCTFLHWIDRVGGRRTADGRQRRPCRQRRQKKNHLIEVAPFDRLDQMLSTLVGLCPPAQNRAKKAWLIKKRLFSMTTFEIRYQEKHLTVCLSVIFFPDIDSWIETLGMDMTPEAHNLYPFSSDFRSKCFKDFQSSEFAEH